MAKHTSIKSTLLFLPLGPVPHCSPLCQQDSSPDPCRPGQGRSAERRDLPPLPHLRRRGHTGQRHAVQVLPTHQGGREPSE